jgi:Ca2+-binding RTX toxin-like protein
MPTSLAQAWEADAGLSAAQRAAGLGHYSDLWLADRAAMLSWMLNANRDDQTSIKSAKVGDEAWSFRDVDSGGSVLVLPEKPLSSTAPCHYVTFGGSGDDALSGAELADHLYGGDGDDTLTGNSGADVLEGGKGKDTYIVTSGGSGDIITDSDGQGGVQWLIGGTRHTLTGVSRYRMVLGGRTMGSLIHLVLNSAGGSDLKVLADGGQLFIRNFTSGHWESLWRPELQKSLE